MKRLFSDILILAGLVALMVCSSCVQTGLERGYWLDVSLASGWKKPAVRLPWHKEVFRSDLETYAALGIRHVTSFAVYMDSAYFKAYPDPVPLREYGEGFQLFDK